MLNKVRICGFKSIKDCVVDLNRINILIGPNGSGKSNFISALSLLQKISDGNLQETVGKTGVGSVLYNGPKTTREIQMEFSFEQMSYGFGLRLNESESNLAFYNECYNKGDQRHDIELMPDRYESGCCSNISADLKHDLNPMLEAKKWRVYQFHDTTSTAGMKQVGMMSDTVSLHQDASNLAPFLYILKQAYPDSYKNILMTIRLVAPFFEDFVLEPNVENKDLILLRWKQEGTDAVFGANQLSDGLLRFICLTVLLLQPSDLQPSVILIEEPELGLHPHALKLLAEIVYVASEKKQIIISTQSADLLDEFGTDDVIVTEMTEDGSEFERLSKYNLENWLDDYSLGTIWIKNIFGGNP